jgi:hypothetical protein
MQHYSHRDSTQITDDQINDYRLMCSDTSAPKLFISSIIHAQSVFDVYDTQAHRVEVNEQVYVCSLWTDAVMTRLDLMKMKLVAHN